MAAAAQDPAFQEAARWEFLYDPDYLALGKNASELDPTGIRNKQRTAFTRVGSVPFPVFCDIALSGWSLDALKKRAASFLGADAADSDEPWVPAPKPVQVRPAV